MHRAAGLALSVLVSASALGCGGSSPAQGAHGGHAMSPEEVDRYAAEWNAESRDAWQNPTEVLELLGGEPGMRFVDLGTGTGYFLPHLSRAAGAEGRVIGLDVEPAFVHRARGRCELDSLRNVEVVEVEADDPGLDGESVDRILVVDTWHAIEGRRDYVRHLYDALRPGGSVLIVEANEDSPHGPPESRRLVAHQVRGELAYAGFEVETPDTGLSYHFVVRGTRPAAP